MSLRRPVTEWSRGVVLCLVPGLLLAGCADGPYAASPPAPAEDATACAGLMGSLPDTLAGEERREVTGGDGRVAAWGDPAIVLTCDVPLPDDFTDTSTCIEANGTGWFVPDSVLESDDEAADVTMTAVGFRPRVEVALPGGYRPDGFQAVIGTIGRLVSAELSLEQRCR
ncbi:hypothetical protein GCM10009623_05380 [Nocardioides aestuarii]|uniref:DUF3515 domain-containing protein n=1 Tax=Nocardioides aestuarii TaxID=252231 RepID=A0ABW4THV4_9ACTN